MYKDDMDDTQEDFTRNWSQHPNSFMSLVNL